MPESKILAIVSGKSITIQPTRKNFQSTATDQELRWLGQGNGVTIGNVDFSKSTNPPLTSGPREDPSNPGQWIATWNATVLGTYPYSIQVLQNNQPVGGPVDPEIENDHMGGAMGGGG